MDLLSYLARHELQANLLRRSAPAHPVPQLRSATLASARHGVHFRHAISADGAELEVEDTTDWWRRQLARGDRAQQLYGGLVLATAESDESVNLLYNREPHGRVAYDRLRVDLPAGGDGGAERLSPWLTDVALAYEADVAWVHTRDLLGLVRSARGPAEEAPAWWAQLPPELLATFAALQPPATLDLCATPEAVWWINVWSADIVRSFGPALAGAGWWRAEELAGGYRLLVTSAEAPDRQHPRALERVGEITRAMELAGVQRGGGVQPCHADVPAKLGDRGALTPLSSPAVGEDPVEPALTRAVDAAGRLLARHCDAEWVTYTRLWPGALAEAPLDWRALPWLVGRGQAKLPALTSSDAALRAEVIASIGAGDAPAVMAVLDQHRSHLHVLFDASQYAAPALVEIIIDYLTASGPGTPDVDGRMLAQTRRPDALLGLFTNLRYHAAIGAFSELVIRGRDVGTPQQRAEALWAAYSPSLGHYAASSSVEGRDATVRLAARQDMSLALELLDYWEQAWPFRAFRDAVEATLARLVRSDAARAVEFVARARTVRRQISWSRHLLRWGALPAETAPFFERLLARHSAQIDLALAGNFTALDDSAWLERTWPGVALQRPLSIAVTFAPALRRLRATGGHERAESIRAQLLPLLAAGQAESAADPLDVLDAFSAPGLPACTPFGDQLP
ncbi:MAG: hypothetical protein HS111_20815 [Kofleriaceae bacterium]|nr:hypothetical protein [Kofleriaceae bacterium]MCL4226629.1 hypothetical protein [Myxococcales bacterium]